MNQKFNKQIIALLALAKAGVNESLRKFEVTNPGLLKSLELIQSELAKRIDSEDDLGWAYRRVKSWVSDMHRLDLDADRLSTLSSVMFRVITDLEERLQIESGYDLERELCQRLIHHLALVSEYYGQQDVSSIEDNTDKITQLYYKSIGFLERLELEKIRNKRRMIHGTHNNIQP